jgi:hypothetical protein
VNDIKLRISSMEAWLDEVKRELKLDEYFESISSVNQGECLMEIYHLIAQEIKKWKKV